MSSFTQEYDEETSSQWSYWNPMRIAMSVPSLLAAHGWPLLGATLLVLYIYRQLKPKLDQWKQAREDAQYHKDPDTALARMEAIQRARERQQELLLEASQRALEAQREREERKRIEAIERLKKYEAEAGGRRLGSADDDYLPLSGGASTSSYRPPKRSACSRGGCGR